MQVSSVPIYSRPTGSHSDFRYVLRRLTVLVLKSTRALFSKYKRGHTLLSPVSCFAANMSRTPAYKFTKVFLMAFNACVTACQMAKQQPSHGHACQKLQTHRFARHSVLPLAFSLLVFLFCCFFFLTQHRILETVPHQQTQSSLVLFSGFCAEINRARPCRSTRSDGISAGWVFHTQIHLPGHASRLLTSTHLR